MMRLRIPIVFALALFISMAPAPAFSSPLQINLALNLPTRPAAVQRFSVRIKPGAARLRGTVCNQRNGQTTRVDLWFEYTVPPGTITFDEIIDRIEITAEKVSGEIAGQAVIDPNQINLNPNRATLSYRATLYYPHSPDNSRYVLRVRVFGNYEWSLSTAKL